MPDQDPQNPPQDPPKTDETAEAFWKTHKEKTTAILDEWFDKKVEKYKGQGTSRTGGRATLPGIIADIMFGKAEK